MVSGNVICIFDSKCAQTGDANKHQYVNPRPVRTLDVWSDSINQAVTATIYTPPVAEMTIF
jgi:hypothetical protein